MKNKIMGVIIVCIFLFSSLSTVSALNIVTTDEEDEEGITLIKGYVKESYTEAPIENVRVTLKSLSLLYYNPPLIGQNFNFTDSNGYYEIEITNLAWLLEPPADEHTAKLIFYEYSYYEKEKTFRLEPNETHTVNIELKLFSHPPSKPTAPEGPSSGVCNVDYSFTTSSTDDDSSIRYAWDWGDGTDIEWTQFYPSGEICEITHSFDRRGIHNVRVQAVDEKGQQSQWSDDLVVIIGNTHPNKPTVLGPTDFKWSSDTCSNAQYTISATDPDEGDSLKFRLVYAINSEANPNYPGGNKPDPTGETEWVQMTSSQGSYSMNWKAIAPEPGKVDATDIALWVEVEDTQGYPALSDMIFIEISKESSRSRLFSVLNLLFEIFPCLQNLLLLFS
jgi:hypothetical protein